jgi:hypothetical protein
MSHQAPRGRHAQQPRQSPDPQDQGGQQVQGPYAPQGQYPPQSQYEQPHYGYQRGYHAQPPQGPPRKKHGLRTWPIIASAVVAAIVAIAIAVGNANHASNPPSASTLAAKIPGCGAVTVNTPAVMEVQDVSCILPGSPFGVVVEIGTFATSAAETQWISDGGNPTTPDPAFFGCCIQGNGWAATVDGDDSYVNTVINAIGGKQVQA